LKCKAANCVRVVVLTFFLIRKYCFPISFLSTFDLSLLNSMKGYFVSSSVFVRSAWLALAVVLVVCCGPVKRLVELRNNKGITTSAQLSLENNKLRTFYREKHEITAPVRDVIQQSPATGMALYFASALILAVLLLEQVPDLKTQYTPAIFLSGIPLYLRVRKLQV